MYNSNNITSKNVYSVSRYVFGYVVQKNIPGHRKTLYLKSIRNGNCTWYTDPIWGKGYKTEKAAYKTIQKIIDLNLGGNGNDQII